MHRELALSALIDTWKMAFRVLRLGECTETCSLLYLKVERGHEVDARKQKQTTASVP